MPATLGLWLCGRPASGKTLYVRQNYPTARQWEAGMTLGTDPIVVDDAPHVIVPLLLKEVRTALDSGQEAPLVLVTAYYPPTACLAAEDAIMFTVVNM
jgi:hypothetical protein